MGFFNRVSLQTPESVELEFTLAGIGNRAYALLIDYLVWGLILIIFIIFSSVLSFYISTTNISFIDSDTYKYITQWFQAIQLIIAFSIYVGYFVFFEVLWQGKTPGKRFVKIRVIRDNGRPVSIQQSTLRALLRPVDDLFFLGVFLIILSKKEKRLGDWVAGTIVIQEEHGIAIAKLSVSQEAESLANKLKKEADLSRLLPEHFAIIRDYLQRRNQMIPEAKVQLARKLAYQVKDIISLENVPEGASANLFLEAVYLGYQGETMNDE